MDEQEHSPQPPEVAHADLPPPPEWNWSRPPAAGDSAPPAYVKGLLYPITLTAGFVLPLLLSMGIGAAIDGKLGGRSTLIGLTLGTVVAIVLSVKNLRSAGRR